MSNELQQPVLEPQAETPPIDPDIVSPQPDTSKRNLRVILGIAVVFILCSILCVALVVTGAGKLMRETAPVELVLDRFMTDMEAKVVESAYALFSPRVQRQMPIDDLENMIAGNNYVLFDGYQTLSVENLNLTAAATTNPDLPQGTVAKVDGTVSYDDGFIGDFAAVLEKVDGTWKLFSIKINVPPDKFQP